MGLVNQNLTESLSQSKFKIRISPSGIHLFDRVSGMNILFEETDIYPELWSLAPRQVSIALSNICDLSCSHCFVPRNGVSLDFDMVKKWLVELDSNGCLGIGFGGGEPTLYHHFVDLCVFATNKTNLAITFTTNGHHLTDELLTALKGHIHFFRISMDGVGKTYERIRGRPFSILLDNLQKCSPIAPFGINYLVNKYTFPEIYTAIEIAETMGASEFLILPEQPINGRGGIDSDTSDSLNLWIKEYIGIIPLTISERARDVVPCCNPLLQETGLLSYVHIDALGHLKRTSFDTTGVFIGKNGVISALRTLQNFEEVSNEIVDRLWI